jgi:hypothetical protein
MAECFAADDHNVAKSYPLSYHQIHLEQQRNDALKDYINKHFNAYRMESFKHGDKSYDLYTKDGKIVVPKVLQKKAVQFYHGLLMHPGETRTELTLAQHFTWKGMRNTVQRVCKNCTSCQLTKPRQRKLGHLPPKQAEITPWETVCIKLIGPYKIRKNKNEAILHCLTMIDPATGWFEIVKIPNKSSNKIANIFEMIWLNK